MGQRDIQTAAEVHNLRAAFLILLFGDFKRIIQGADLSAQCSNLLVQQFNPCQCLGRDFPLAFELLLQGRQLRARLIALRPEGIDNALQLAGFVTGKFEIVGECGKGGFNLGL